MTSKIFSLLVDLMKSLQPSANKRNKKVSFKNINTLINTNEVGEDELKLLFTGDEKMKLLGLCHLAGKKTRTNKFKDSAKTMVVIIHELLYLSKKKEQIREEFVIYEETIKVMLLGEHYSSNKLRDIVYSKKVLDLIKVVVEKRPLLEISEYIRKANVEDIKKALHEYELSRRVGFDKIEENNYYNISPLSENYQMCLEPKTWEDVVKLKNKKLLTGEIINLNYINNNEVKLAIIDENKELEEEIINNFVDPLTNDMEKLDFSAYTEEERRKIHLQSETYDPIFFLEKLYSNINLHELEEFLQILEENLTHSATDQDNLIDKNIYKYLDCKKLLDFIVGKFKIHCDKLINFKEKLTKLQVGITETLQPLKTSFDLILKSKSSKEIILKFAKFFQIKDNIDYYMKFSNFEVLADYLKKINVEMKEISQNRYIYREFNQCFFKTIENFKEVLMKIIKESSVNNLVIKHFRYLLEFDIESETVDLLLNGLKEKMCKKIKNDLELFENFEIRNFKDFFCEEFNVENLEEEAFRETSKMSDKFLKNPNCDDGDHYKHDHHDKDLKNNCIDDIKADKKKNLINVESILKTLYIEIKDYLLMMKVLEENINVKKILSSSQKSTRFNSIFTEIYLTLFEKLKEFLYVKNFNVAEILEKNYDNDKVAEIFKTESSVTLVKNSYLYEKDQANFLIMYYKNSKIADTIFNENFNKNTLESISNLLIDLFELFESYLEPDALDALIDTKRNAIERIFMAFLNEKIISNLNFFNEESTINLFDTQLSIFNFSAFSFTKTFMKNVFKSYKSIIEFYINILTRSKDIDLNHEVIYYSLFYLLKSFLLKFYDYYKAEADGSDDYKRLNCLIVEIMKNFNYLKTEINTILKTIFKNKLKEYLVYLVDLENFLICLKNMFSNKYTINTSNILFNLFIPSNKGSIILKNSIGYTSSNYTYNFYEKYNNLLLYDGSEISKTNNFPPFTDIRSVFIDMIFHLADTVKIFNQLELEKAGTSANDFSSLDRLSKLKIKGKANFTENIYGTTINERLISIVGDVIYDFLESLLTYISNHQNKDSTRSFFSPCKNNFKLVSQIYFEIQLLQTILINFISSRDKIKEKLIIIKNTLLKILYEIRNVNEGIYEECFVLNQDEIERKKNIIEDYSIKYSAYFKSFKIKL